MTNLKMVGVRMRTEEKMVAGKKQSIQVLETKYQDEKALCKQCGKEPRQRASSRCEKCAKQYRFQQANDDRLQRKIAGEIKK